MEDRREKERKDSLYKQSVEELYQAIVDVKDKRVAKDFLEDLLTPQELVALSGRVHCARLFLEGKTYSEVNAETDVSSATLARIHKCLTDGTGYNEVLGPSVRAAGDGLDHGKK